MQLKFLSLVLLFAPIAVNADQNEALPNIELLEFLGSYSQEEQTWLELAMEQEQQMLKKDKSSTASVGDGKHD